MVLELARPSEPWCFAAGSCFFRSYCTGISSSSRHLRAAAGDRLSRKKLFFQDFRRHVRQFFCVVLKLARPLEPWCFAAGSCFFRSYCTGISSSSRHLRAAAGDRLSRKKLFFQDFRRHVRQFFGVVLDLARPSEPWCFAAGSCFFRTPPVVRAAVGDRISRQSTNTVFLCCFYAVFLLFF